MKLKIKVTKKLFYIVSGFIAALAIVIFALAGYDNPDVFGHKSRDLDLGIITIDSTPGAELVTIDGEVDITHDLTAGSVTAESLEVKGDLEATSNTLIDPIRYTIPAGGKTECEDGRIMVGFEAPAIGTWSIVCAKI